MARWTRGGEVYFALDKFVWRYLSSRAQLIANFSFPCSRTVSRELFCSLCSVRSMFAPAMPPCRCSPPTRQTCQRSPRGELLFVREHELETTWTCARYSSMIVCWERPAIRRVDLPIICCPAKLSREEIQSCRFDCIARSIALSDDNDLSEWVKGRAKLVLLEFDVTTYFVGEFRHCYAYKR